MKKKSIFTVLFLFAHIYFLEAQQIITDNTQQPNELIQNLLGDGCATAINVSSAVNGSVNGIVSYGTFERGNSNFLLQNGIVLSTGSVSSAGNNFIGEDLSEGDLNWTTDTDILDVLGIDQTLNATTLEFDFTSINSSIGFKYIFASDEYQQQYPCNFQDVFGILIKRVDSTDPYVNIAFLPDSNATINTNSIHPEIVNGCSAVNEDFFEGYNVGNTNFGGQTVVLNASTVIIPGVTYRIKFVIADHIDYRFDSAVFIESEGFGSSVNLGPDVTACGSSVVLDGTIDNNQASYKWFKDAIEIVGETNSTLQALESGNYSIEVTIPLPNGTCTMTDAVFVDTIPFQQAEPITDITICDEIPYDGIAIFDLSLKNDEIMQNLPSSNFVISYHVSQDDAFNNLNPILGDYENTELSETLYVRIESLDESCLQIGSFNIEIGQKPNFRTIPPIVLCADFLIDGVGYIELSYYAFEIANYEFNRTVSFHTAEQDAYNGTNPITFASEVPFGSTFAYVRIENDFTGCITVVPISVILQQLIDLPGNFFIDMCLPPNQSVATFDLDSLRDEIRAQYPDAIISFYTNLIDAQNESFPIFPGVVYQNQEPFQQTIYMGVTIDNQPCPSVFEVDLHTNLTYNTIGPQTTINRCDDISNDGIVDFDLIEVSNELQSGNGINFTYYLTEEDRLNEVNPINQNSPFTVSSASQIIFATASVSGCENDIDVTLKINPLPTIEPQVVDFCGNPNFEEGYTTIQLNPLINLVSEQFEDAIITLYNSEAAAILGDNPLRNSFNAINDAPIFFMRVANSRTGCFDVTTLQVNIADGLAISKPESIIICDEDQDASATVNLESVLPQLSDDLSSVIISYHNTLDNALRDRFPILNPTSYTTESTEIFIRVNLVGLDCFVVVSFEVLIYANPQLNAVSDYTNCEVDVNGDSDFFLITKDEEIINGQIGMQVLYFENESDAINRENQIDKTQAYTNTSNPQTLYLRLENVEGNSCFKTAAMQIDVKQAPIYTEPTTIYKCNYNGTGLNAVDFNEKIDEIISGSTQDLNVTFYANSLNASLGVNPLSLNYTTITNPQVIHARVENLETSCFSISTFEVITLALPDVNFSQSLVSCGDNYEFEQQWDLTQIELLTLEGRQYGIEFSYFESELDLISNTNQIISPENYSNTSNPQTVYIKVRNVSTDCFASVPFSLIINSPPIINPIETYEICDNAEGNVNLSEIDEILLENTFNVLVTYHSSEADAEANLNPLSNNYSYSNTTETLFVRVEYSTTNCYAVHPFQLIVNPLPVANQPDDLMVCDDDFDGIASFDLSTQDIVVLNGQNPNTFTVSYYNSEINAIQNNLALSPEYVGLDGELIYARVENSATSCFDITPFSLVVNPLPNIEIEDLVLCLDNLPLVVSADTYNSSDSYLWSTNETSSAIEITEFGTYSVTVTSEFGCEITNTFNVTESESAIIDVIETIDFSDPNNITVTVNGIGNYLYQLNDGTTQASNVFENVPIGINTITIIDQNGCAQVTRQVLVIDTPKHLTPNNDGDFDTWHIVGVETLAGTTITIFDRFGKQLKQLDANSQGWDGSYNGNKMPADDYWFVAEVIQNGNSFIIKGHFALKR